MAASGFVGNQDAVGIYHNMWTLKGEHKSSRGCGCDYSPRRSLSPPTIDPTLGQFFGKSSLKMGGRTGRSPAMWCRTGQHAACEAWQLPVQPVDLLACRCRRATRRTAGHHDSATVHPQKRWISLGITPSQSRYDGQFQGFSADCPRIGHQVDACCRKEFRPRPDNSSLPATRCSCPSSLRPPCITLLAPQSSEGPMPLQSLRRTEDDLLTCFVSAWRGVSAGQRFVAIPNARPFSDLLDRSARSERDPGNVHRTMIVANGITAASGEKSGSTSSCRC